MNREEMINHILDASEENSLEHLGIKGMKWRKKRKSSVGYEQAGKLASKSVIKGLRNKGIVDKIRNDQKFLNRTKRMIKTKFFHASEENSLEHWGIKGMKWRKKRLGADFGSQLAGGSRGKDIPFSTIGGNSGNTGEKTANYLKKLAPDVASLGKAENERKRMKKKIKSFFGF